jgi:hypothetical protein
MSLLSKSWLPVLLLASGCNDGPAAGFSVITMQVTDAAVEFSMVEQAVLQVSKVEIHLATDPVGQLATLYSGVPLSFDLRALVNGTTQTLLQPQLDPGVYDQVRLTVSGGTLELTNGNVYSAAAGNISVVGTGEVDVFLSPAVDLAAGAVETVLLDFDLTKTFVPVPPADPLTATSYDIQPTVKGSDLSATGAVSGSVVQSAAGGGFEPVDGATIYLLPPGVTDPALSVASTGTDVDGGFAILGVAPGTYDVQAIKGAMTDVSADEIVTAGATATADLLIN